MKKMIYLMIFVALAGFYACDQANEKQNVEFYLTDAPADQNIESVFVDVQSIKYSLNDETWVDVPISAVVVDLLKFSNGSDTLLSNIELNTGERIQQVRLLLGENNYIVFKDGSIENLTTPSAQESGLKINVHSDVEVTSGYKVVIDFDANRSIVATGSGKHILKPVIRAYIHANTSRIFGNLVPSDVPTKVFTVTELNDTIATVSDTTQNNLYVLHGLFSGVYDVVAEDLTTGELDTIAADVQVIGGTDKDLGTTVLFE